MSQPGCSGCGASLIYRRRNSKWCSKTCWMKFARRAERKSLVDEVEELNRKANADRLRRAREMLLDGYGYAAFVERFGKALLQEARSTLTPEELERVDVFWSREWTFSRNLEANTTKAVINRIKSHGNDANATG